METCAEYSSSSRMQVFTSSYVFAFLTLSLIHIFSFNTSVARLMEYLNALQKYESLGAERNIKFFKACVDDFLRLLAPFAPHFTEELWEITGHKNSVFEEAYPVADESALVKDETEYAIQINSKIRAKIMIAKGLTNEEIQAAVCASPEIAQMCIRDSSMSLSASSLGRTKRSTGRLLLMIFCISASIFARSSLVMGVTKSMS